MARPRANCVRLPQPPRTANEVGPRTGTPEMAGAQINHYEPRFGEGEIHGHRNQIRKSMTLSHTHTKGRMNEIHCFFV
jgi:hypothetical protein